MKETFFAKITDVLPSRVNTVIGIGTGEDPVVRPFDSTAMVGVIDLTIGNVFKIEIETNPGEVIMRYSPAQKSDYIE